MMGDGTEEQNLGQPGNPAARIKEEEVDAAFGKGGKNQIASIPIAESSPIPRVRL